MAKNSNAFEVENALVLYASNFVIMSAAAIYEDELIRPDLGLINECHIYLIGLVPKVEFVGAEKKGTDVVASFIVANNPREVRWSPPPDISITCGPSMEVCIQANGEKQFIPIQDAMFRYLHKMERAVDFKILYIGQAYGLNGARSALDRLKKHEILQKIAVKGVPEAYSLTILMLSLELGTDLLTMFNPNARDKSNSLDRMNKGLDKLHNTTEAERIALYEAALIRYFQPPFNTAFKDSFPSTNMKLLADCYNKDFSALAAEINIDDLPYVLFSDVIEHKPYHIAFYDLHTEDDRKLFFSLFKPQV
jgi:hypothetical protein